MSDKLLISRRAFTAGAVVLGLGRESARAQGFAGLGVKGSGFADVRPGKIFSFPEDPGIFDNEIGPLRHLFDQDPIPGIFIISLQDTHQPLIRATTGRKIVQGALQGSQDIFREYR